MTVPLYGRLGDVYGRRPLFLVAIAIFLVGSALCGVAQEMTELVLARGVQGLGAGGLLSLSLAVIGAIVPPRERGRWQGLIGARLRLGVDHRPGGRRVHRRHHELALGVPRQPSDRRPRRWS